MAIVVMFEMNGATSSKAVIDLRRSAKEYPTDLEEGHAQGKVAITLEEHDKT